MTQHCLKNVTQHFKNMTPYFRQLSITEILSQHFTFHKHNPSMYILGNPYINAILNSCMGLLSNVVVFLSKRFGRRRTLSFSYVVAGLCCLLSTMFSVFGTDNNGQEMTLKCLVSHNFF